MPDIVPSAESDASTALTIPDPRLAPTPVGWATTTFASWAEEMTWEDLDEYEAQLLAVASYIQSMDGDTLEFQKALRIVERRRGLLLAPAQGKRTDLETGSAVLAGSGQLLPRVGEVDADVSRGTATRYRTIAAFWEPIVWPHVLEADRVCDVTQAAILRLIRSKNAPEPKATEDTTELTPEELAEFGPEPEYDVEHELDLALKDIERLEALVESLSASDLGAEVRTWSAKFAQLQGRVLQLTRSEHEATTQARWQGDVLRKVRAALGVERSGEILPALLRLVNAT